MLDEHNRNVRNASTLFICQVMTRGQLEQVSIVVIDDDEGGSAALLRQLSLDLKVVRQVEIPLHATAWRRRGWSRREKAGG